MLARLGLPAYASVMIDPIQIRAARAMLNWTQKGLAEHSGIAEVTIKKIEKGTTDARGSTLGAIQAAFERAGIQFLDAGDTRTGGPGVRLKG